MKKATLSVRFPQSTFDTIKDRTTISGRSLNAEIIYLVNMALEQREKNLEEIRDLLRSARQTPAPGSVAPVDSQPLATATP